MASWVYPSHLEMASALLGMVLCLQETPGAFLLLLGQLRRKWPHASHSHIIQREVGTGGLQMQVDQVVGLAFI